MTQINQEREPLTHQDVEDEVAHLKRVWKRLPNCGAAEDATDYLGKAEAAAHQAVEGGAESVRRG